MFLPLLVVPLLVVIPGLDRLPGTAIESMPDDLWAKHTAEVRLGTEEHNSEWA